MENNEYKKGLLAMLGCMLIWGVLPVYWQVLIPISSWVIILYRILLVCVCGIVVATIKYGWTRIWEPLKDRDIRIKYFTAGAIITVNWSTFIYTVNSGQVVQSSIGYYIEPLFICLVGNIVFKEKFTKYNVTAICLAFTSVIIILFHFGELPKLALILAITFSIYTAIKKTVKQPPLISLVYETLIFAPPALIAIIYLEMNGKGALAVATPLKYGLLLCCGILTLIPLGLFAYAAQRIPVFHIGLMQYISPTISLILGLTVLGESVDFVQIICFCIIWIGLVFFLIGEYKAYKKGLDG